MIKERIKRKDLIIIFFFFFDDINEHPIVQKALWLVCGNKLVKDGYCDMSEYIYSRIDKREILLELEKSKSKFSELYKKSYSNEKSAYSNWIDFFREYFINDENCETEYTLSLLEAKAIINWFYRAFSNFSKREKKTIQLLSGLRNIYNIDTLKFAHGIIYNELEIEINLITSFEKFYKYIKDIQASGDFLFYRGHADVNYTLLPSIMRHSSWLEHERDLYNDIIIECPANFEKCNTHLERLAEMQHYGLPTRLLDVTQNPLVALYFACIDSSKLQGELIIFDVTHDKIKYPNSDTVSILASLPLLKSKIKNSLFDFATDSKLSQNDFNLKASLLLHEIKLEKPAFRDEIIKSDIVNCFFVRAEKKNARIIKQDGAFIICGLFDEKNSIINQYRYKLNGKKQVFIIDQKAKKGIIDQLDKLSINKAQLFPEIQDVATYIKSKY